LILWALYFSPPFALYQPNVWRMVVTSQNKANSAGSGIVPGTAKERAAGKHYKVKSLFCVCAALLYQCFAFAHFAKIKGKF
jgi:hypothetical protein